MKWSQSEKRIARSVFQRAVDMELDELMAEFKRRAADVRTPEQMWALRNHLERTERDFQSKYDFRYSQLLFVFSRLVGEGRVDEQELHGLSEDKLQCIRDMLPL